MSASAKWPELVKHPEASDHLVHVYQDARLLADAIAEFVAAGLSLGEGALVIARRERHEAILAALGAKGQHATSALRLLDAGEALQAVMAHEHPQWIAFEAVCGAPIAELRLQYPGVRAYGEMVDILWQEGRRRAALHLEEYWNELARPRPFALLCAYGIDPLDGAAYSAGFEHVCRAHSHLIPSPDCAAFNQAVDRAARQVLAPPLAQMLVSLSAAHQPRTEMPLGQAVLFWLKQNMPRTAEKVLREVRASLA